LTVLKNGTITCLAKGVLRTHMARGLPLVIDNTKWLHQQI